jgi:hypothetical protein
MKHFSCGKLVFALLVGSASVVTISALSSSFAQPGTAASGSAQTTVEPQSGSGPASDEEPPFEDSEVAFPTPVCRAGIEQFDTAVGQLGMVTDLQSIHSALQQAISSDDPQLGQYVKERLSELIGQDANRALEVITWAENAQQLELAVYMQAVRDSAAVRAPQVAERLLTMGEHHADQQHRVAALMALQTQASLNATQLDRLAALGKDKAEERVAMIAVSAIGMVMENDPERFEEYVTRLLDIAESPVNEGVVYFAVAMSGIHTQPPFGDVSLQRLANIVLHHPAKHVRVEAALVVSTARNTEAVLRVYRQAFLESTDLCFRWDMFRFSARAAGAKALPLLKELADVDPRFQPEYQDYTNLYASGVVEFDRLEQATKGRYPCHMGPDD